MINQDDIWGVVRLVAEQYNVPYYLRDSGKYTNTPPIVVPKTSSFLLNFDDHPLLSLTKSYMVTNHGEMFTPELLVVVNEWSTVNISYRTMKRLATPSKLLGDVLYCNEILIISCSFGFLE